MHAKMLLPRALSVVALFSVTTSALNHAHGARHEHLHKRADAPNSTAEYDYIVVGSGPGGAPLAARLALNGSRVLLIDAGDDQGHTYHQQVPALQLQSTEFGPMKWDYYVNHYADLARQEQDSKMTYRTPSGELHVGPHPPAGSEPLGILYPRAGTLGGCSTHNAMVTIYPHESDWTYIQTLTGDDSWSPGSMRKYFQRLEKNRYVPRSAVGHGYDGWLETTLTDLTLVAEDPGLLSLIVAAATGMGRSLLGKLLTTVAGLGEVLTQDVNAGAGGRDQATGLYQVPLAVTEAGVRTGPRDFVLSVANATRADGSRKYHLDIKLQTLVTNVRFDTSGDRPRAVGVDYLEGRSLYRADPRAANVSGAGARGSVDAAKEVVLSAGAFNTPQLLKLSGVGARAELERLGIPVVAELPGVGTNLQDRYETGVVGRSDVDFVITAQCTFLRSEPDPCLERWKAHPHSSVLRGTYATNGIAIAVVVKSSVADGDPDVLVSGAPVNFRGYHPGYADAGLADAKHWTWIVLKAHSRNRAGTVTLRSTDPRDVPVVNFNSFDAGTTADGAADRDVAAVVEGLKYGRQIFRDLVPLHGDFAEVWPGPANVATDDEWTDFVRREAWGHHAACTCPIGADDDPDAVLDSRFRVRGVDGLRVVDASVFPRIPGFYIVLPIYMVSEKASDVILEDNA